jgi:O-acetyl-ADP-ribose deacetylase (regulator of RNase III)
VTQIATVLERGRTKWILKCGNILDEQADVLICSVNVSLNLSGGVGADLLARYGTKMQQDLHRLIACRTPRAAKRGEVFPYADSGLPYKAVLHAVAVDGWYETTSGVVEHTVRDALEIARGIGSRKVALTALATGFGNLSLAEFADAIRPLLPIDFSPIEEIHICLIEDYRVDELISHLCGS